MIKNFFEDHINVCIADKTYKLNKIDYLRAPLSKIFNFMEFYGLIEKVTISETIDVMAGVSGKPIVLHFPLAEKYIDCYHIILTENLIAGDTSLANQIKKELAVPLQFDKPAKFLKMKISLPADSACYAPGFYFKFTMANFSEYLFPEFEKSVSLSMPFDENLLVSINDEGCYHYPTNSLRLKIIITHYK